MTRAAALGVVLCLSMGALGCEEEPVTQGASVANKVKRKEAPPEEEKKEATDVPEPVAFQEAEFVETERSRDPFRSYVAFFINEAQGRVKSQREVVLDQYAIEELKLVGIVTRVHPARAMLVDPSGIGHVVLRGQFVGRPAVVQASGAGGAAYEVNWRIDRIRDGDIVLVREDPSNPDVPTATRVIPLRSDEISVGAGKEGAAAEEKDLNREVEALRRRLQAMEERPSTVQVVTPESKKPPPGAPEGVIRNPTQ